MPPEGALRIYASLMLWGSTPWRHLCRHISFRLLPRTKVPVLPCLGGTAAAVMLRTFVCDSPATAVALDAYWCQHSFTLSRQCAGAAAGAAEHQAGHAAGTKAAAPGQGAAGRGEKNGAPDPEERSRLLRRHQSQPHGACTLKACRGEQPTDLE